MKYRIAGYISEKFLSSKSQIFFILISVSILLALLVGWISARCSYHNVLEVAISHVEKDLKMFENLLNLKYPGEWKAVDGKLYKGIFLVNENFEMVDFFERITGNTATIFLGDTRVTTTIRDEIGARIIGTKVSLPVAQRVLVQGKEYYGVADILGEKYVTAYKPIKDPSGKIIGILYTGIPLAKFEPLKHKFYLTILTPYLILLILFIFNVLIIFFWARAVNLSIIDPLTRVYNRRYEIHRLKQEILKRQAKKDYQFSLILIDLDDFKQINDIYGHTEGDRVLKEFAELIKQRIRNQDVFGRWGGEEFLLLCPETPLEGAKTLAEILRQLIANHTFGENKLKITASFGVTSYNEGDDLETILNRLDKALYQGKIKGKNCVVTF
ncbi:diguanylate cyclase [Thermodesulfobacterium sp. TA1]|uniref:diguanylate cyclase n=1 Tax=Thermodesulfobacterium sp. TA1 TaxID=2234087 RepID=UPI0012321246|nr:diguanylate cyclase [Thermodesulfobacterium sp. TA1]QER41517.1 diguanylate cyclase [Thermodesulfobacterium sp. TA1]